MDIDTNVILTSLVTSCIPALIAYLTATTQAKSRLKELEQSHKSDLEKMKLEYELRNQEKQSDSQNELISKVFTGDLDLEKLTDSMSQLEALSKKVQKSQSSTFVKNQK